MNTTSKITGIVVAIILIATLIPVAFSLSGESVATYTNPSASATRGNEFVEDGLEITRGTITSSYRINNTYTDSGGLIITESCIIDMSSIYDTVIYYGDSTTHTATAVTPHTITFNQSGNDAWTSFVDDGDSYVCWGTKASGWSGTPTVSVTVGGSEYTSGTFNASLCKYKIMKTAITGDVVVNMTVGSDSTKTKTDSLTYTPDQPVIDLDITYEDSTITIESTGLETVTIDDVDSLILKNNVLPNSKYKIYSGNIASAYYDKGDAITFGMMGNGYVIAGTTQKVGTGLTITAASSTVIDNGIHKYNASTTPVTITGVTGTQYTILENSYNITQGDKYPTVYVMIGAIFIFMLVALLVISAKFKD